MTDLIFNIDIYLCMRIYWIMICDISKVSLVMICHIQLLILLGIHKELLRHAMSSRPLLLYPH